MISGEPKEIFWESMLERKDTMKFLIPTYPFPISILTRQQKKLGFFKANFSLVANSSNMSLSMNLLNIYMIAFMIRK